MINPNDPAVHCVHCRDGHLTKHEYFAAMAMQGILSSPREVTRRKNETIHSCIVRLSVEFADLLIAELNKGSEK